MSPSDAVVLTGYIQAHFPQQPINEYTPDALHELLSPYAITDCKAAVLALATRTSGDNSGRDGKKWCSPTEVYAEVRRLREDRINDEVIDMPPGLDPDDTAAYARVLAEGRRRLANGEQVARAELTGRDLPDLPQAGTSLPELERMALRQKIAAANAAHKAVSAPLEPLPALPAGDVDQDVTDDTDGAQNGAAA